MFEKIKQNISILHTQQNKLRFLLSRIYRYSGLWRSIDIHRPGYRLRLHPAQLSLSLYVYPTCRQSDSDFLELYLKPGDLFIDVGANIGHLSIEAALLVGPTGSVWAFEGHPQTAQRMRENVALNGIRNIYLAQTAVGHEFGWVTFSDDITDDQNRVTPETTGLTVPMVRLESFIKHTQVSLLKIDVEGFEKQVLEGCGDALGMVECIYFEVDDTHFEAVGYTFEEMYDLLKTFGFVVCRLSGGTLVPLESGQQKFPQCENLIAYHPRSNRIRDGRIL